MSASLVGSEMCIRDRLKRACSVRRTVPNASRASGIETEAGSRPRSSSFERLRHGRMSQDRNSRKPLKYNRHEVD
eukprot:1299901-Alexandrium_andersonii.AAC.1